MSRLPDPFRQGLARGWRVTGGPHGELPESLTCDVAIVGTGAGAGITASQVVTLRAEVAYTDPVLGRMRVVSPTQAVLVDVDDPVSSITTPAADALVGGDAARDGA